MLYNRTKLITIFHMYFIHSDPVIQYLPYNQCGECNANRYLVNTDPYTTAHTFMKPYMYVRYVTACLRACVTYAWYSGYAKWIPYQCHWVWAACPHRRVRRDTGASATRVTYSSNAICNLYFVIYGFQWGGWIDVLYSTLIVLIYI